jgi:hypothetical protein
VGHPQLKAQLEGFDCKGVVAIAAANATTTTAVLNQPGALAYDRNFDASPAKLSPNHQDITHDPSSMHLKVFPVVYWGG